MKVLDPRDLVGETSRRVSADLIVNLASRQGRGRGGSSCQLTPGLIYSYIYIIKLLYLLVACLLHLEGWLFSLW